MNFHEFCSIHKVNGKEKYELAHYLAGMRYKNTIMDTIGTNWKLFKKQLQY